MAKGIDEAVRVLRDQGAIVEEVVFPDIWDYHICGRVIITVEAHAIHRQEVIETPEKFGYTTRRRFQLGAFLTAEQYLSALRFRRKLQLDTRAAMRGYDLVMAPNQWGAPEIFEEPQAIFHFLGKPSLSMPFNVTGQPALTVCCGFGSDGFPLAFQLAGRPFDEASVFAAGAAYERATPWRLRTDPRFEPQEILMISKTRLSRRSILAGASALALPAGFGTPALRPGKGRALRHLDGRHSAHHAASPIAAPAPTSSPATRSTIRWSPGRWMSPTGRAS